MKTLGAVLVFLVSSAYGQTGSSESCQDVTSKLVAFERAAMGPMAPMVSGVVQTATGVELLSEPYLQQFVCPWIESETISDVGDALRSSGLLRIAVENLSAFEAVTYGHAKRAIASGTMVNMEHQPPAQREFFQALLDTAAHLEDMGYMNLNPEGFAKIQVLASMVAMGGPGGQAGPVSAYPGNPGDYTAARRQEILLQDFQTLVNKARDAAGPQWPMVAMMINMYSGGLVDLNNQESVNNLVRAYAAVDSLDTLYEFVSSTVMMPLLNFYYPQLGMAFAQGEQYMQIMVEHAYSPDQLEQEQLKASTFAAFHAAVRATGVLNVHW